MSDCTSTAPIPVLRGYPSTQYTKQQATKITNLHPASKDFLSGKFRKVPGKKQEHAHPGTKPRWLGKDEVAPEPR